MRTEIIFETSVLSQFDSLTLLEQGSVTEFSLRESFRLYTNTQGLRTRMGILRNALHLILIKNALLLLQCAAKSSVRVLIYMVSAFAGSMCLVDCCFMKPVKTIT